jgi:hypothetical protein
MKKIILLLICSLAANIAFSQTSRHTNKITRDKTGYVKEYETTDFAFSINNGTALNIYDKKSNSILGKTQSIIFGATVFYNNFFVMADFRPVIVYIRNKNRILNFPPSQNFEGSYEITIFNFTHRFGYTYNLGGDFGIEPYAAYLRTNFVLADEDLRKNLNIKKGNGFTAGVKINKYFKLKGFGNYFVVYLDNNINYSGMKRIHPALGNSFYSVEVGIALKSWISRRKID